MRRIENECHSCDLPCVDCGRKHVERVYCDCCEAPLDTLFGYDGVVLNNKELCYDCAKASLIDKFYYSEKRKRDFYRYSDIDDAEFINNLDEMTNEDLREVMMDEDFNIIADDCGVEWKEID